MRRETARKMLPSPVPSSRDDDCSANDDCSQKDSHPPKPSQALRPTCVLSPMDLRLENKGSSASTWHNGNFEFNMLVVRAMLRAPNDCPGQLVQSYRWYPDAVPVDALLPPGVRLSLKEIFIYYPHHVRWQDIMVRLSQNDYRGTDILNIQVMFQSASFSLCS